MEYFPYSPFRVLEEFSDPFPHAMGDLTEDVRFTHFESALYGMLASIQDQTHACGIHGAVHQIDEPTDPDGDPSPDRDIEDLLRQLRETLQDGRSTRQDHPEAMSSR